MKVGDQLFNVKKEKVGRDGKKHYQDVGTALIRGGSKTGVLWLNHLDGEYALFARDRQEVSTSGADGAAADGASNEPSLE